MFISHTKNIANGNHDLIININENVLCDFNIRYIIRKL